LFRNKGRTILTMLGIVIGVASVIIMLSVGYAAQNYILSQVASFGSDLLFIRNGPGTGSTGSGPPNMSVKQTLTLKDYKKLKQQNWITAVDASVFKDLLVEYENASQRVRISGVSEDDITIYNTALKQGDFISSNDVDSKTNVAVLGIDTAKDLFGAEEPIGKRIKINKISYRVIGVLDRAGTRFFTNLDKGVYVPFTALMQDQNMEHIQFISFKIGTVPPAIAKERIQYLLRDSHNLNNPEGDLSKDDFFVSTQEDAAQRAGIIGSILQILLGSIAAISLIVGGVGIMNIMFVTVTERTREIGLRKAIGALKSDILAQFLIEAVVLCILGGMIGILSGVGFSWLGIKLLQTYNSNSWIFIIPWNGVALGFGVSTLIGVVFGYYPAKRASELNPIEALQYE